MKDKGIVGSDIIGIDHGNGEPPVTVWPVVEIETYDPHRAWRGKIGAFNNKALDELKERDSRIYAVNTASTKEDPTVPEDVWRIRAKDEKISGWSRDIMVSTELIHDSTDRALFDLLYRMLRW